MSFRSRLLQFIQNDNTIYQLLLIGLFIASPSLHYLCFYNSYDPLWLRFANSLLCIIALGFSFHPVKIYYRVSQYLTIAAFLLINNCLLLSRNGFEHVYLFSSITIFIALTLFCKKRWEFIAICIFNLLCTVIAYITAPKLYISVGVLCVILLTFTFIAYISFLVLMAYTLKLKKTVSNVIELNQNLMVNDEKLRRSRKKLNSLINSLNDIIFEFDENRICHNTWFNKSELRVIDPRSCIGKTLDEVIGSEKAKKFNNALDHVIKTHEPISITYPSDFGTGQWFVCKMAPVYDKLGNYTSRICASLTDISEQKKYADALKLSEVLLLEAQAIAKTGNWSIDHQTKEDYWSDNLYVILEVDQIPEGMNKLDYYLNMIHPDYKEEAIGYFSTIRVSGKREFEHKLITPRGNIKYFKAIKGDIVCDEEGNPKRAVGILQDITESKLSEKMIRVSQAELLEAQIIARIGNWKWDITQKRVTWSEEINNIFEIDPKIAAENNLSKILIRYCHPQDRGILKENLKSIDNITNTSYEYRIITPNGKIKYLSIIVGKIIKKDNGVIRKIIGTIQDITDRKIAEIEYKRTESKYKLVLETIKLPAISLDKESNIIFCNKYMADLLGYGQTEILGLNWLDTFIPEGFKDELIHCFDQSTFEPQFTNPVKCRNGEQRMISWQNTVSHDENGHIKEITAIGEDITDRQKATQALIYAKEEAEKSSRFKSEFLSIMSHEIRTPMNAVIGTTNLLLSEDPKPDQLEYLNTLKFSGENLLAIINDILDYNKIEAGKLQLNKLTFSILNLTQKIKQSFYAKAAEKELDIELFVDNEIPEFLKGDQVRLGQILNNLLGNAIKFTHTGRITLRLEKEMLNLEEVGIRFSITDTGIGIAGENLALIFDPFMQESQAADADYGGTGLGLAITKRLIELHQSAIRVVSEPGKGTKFNFSILFEIDEKSQEAANKFAQKIIQAPAASLKGMKVLVVDDNKMNLLIASRFLKKWQIDGEEATGGYLAIEMVKNKEYDLVIMDLQMPEIDGFETTKILKVVSPHTPVIALTADAMPETHNKALAAGMCDYLTKPFAPEKLFEKIAKHYPVTVVD